MFRLKKKSVTAQNNPVNFIDPNTDVDNSISSPPNILDINPFGFIYPNTDSE